MVNSPSSIQIGGMRIDAGTYQSVSRKILDWARAHASKYVCVANVHMVMESYDSESFRDIVNSSAFVTSDGMPLVWALRHRGCPAAERVYGPTLMLELCKRAAEENVSVGFFGGSESTLLRLRENLLKRFPTLEIKALISPPFGPELERQTPAFIEQLRNDTPGVLFIGLGCPKQEIWMHQNRGKLSSVMVGVGAAFAFHAGTVKQAPAALQKYGLEWLFRLMMEPRRLWRRYLWHNPRFLLLMAYEQSKIWGIPGLQPEPPSRSGQQSPGAVV
jgi:N-acetylglucosaminyldiphosphoundecaprenol N-acetyl-beta-D-mannosaminyltransferase